MAGVPQLLGQMIGQQAQQPQAPAPARQSTQQMGQQAGMSSYGTMSMGQDWQRLYDDLAPEAAPITMQQQRAPMQVQPQAQQQQAPNSKPAQEADSGFMQGLMGMFSDPVGKNIHDGLTRQFAESAQPIVYEYNDEAQERYGMPPGMRMGVDARRIADEGGPMGREVVTETEEGLKMIKPDEGLGAAMAVASKATLENQQQQMQMQKMMEMLDKRFFEMEMRDRMRSKV